MEIALIIEDIIELPNLTFPLMFSAARLPSQAAGKGKGATRINQTLRKRERERKKEEGEREREKRTAEDITSLRLMRSLGDGSGWG